MTAVDPGSRFVQDADFVVLEPDDEFVPPTIEELRGGPAPALVASPPPTQPRDWHGRWIPKGGFLGGGVGARPSVAELSALYASAPVSHEVRPLRDAGRARPVYEALHYDALPQVVSRAELDQAVAASPVGLLHRVVGTPAQAEEFRTGDLFVGEGYSGTGTYTMQGTDEEFADFKRGFQSWQFVSHDDELHMVLTPDAKILTRGPGSLETYADAHSSWGEIHNDPGALAAADGYDAVVIPGGAVLVLNRAKVIVAEAIPGLADRQRRGDA